MLEARDLAAIKSMMESVMDERFEKVDERFERIDERFEKIDERFEKLLKEMDTRFEKSEAKLLKEMDIRIGKSEARIRKEIDTRLAKSENLVLQELDRTRGILEDRIRSVEVKVDELSQYYQITKLEESNAALMLKRMEDFSNRLRSLERKADKVKYQEMVSVY